SDQCRIPWHAENRCSRGGWQRRSVTVRTAVVCPCTPLLVPQISGSRPDMSRLRGLCVDAVESMLAGDIDHVTVLGPPAGNWDTRAGGTLAGYGVDVRVGGPVPGLTGEHLLGAWLLDTAGWAGTRSYTGGDRKSTRLNSSHVSISYAVFC